MGIVRFALRFPHTFYVVAALILFLGFAAIRSMPTDIFPEIRIPVVTVIRRTVQRLQRSGPAAQSQFGQSERATTL
jgi:Cu/Ag efflux pump CusA